MPQNHLADARSPYLIQHKDNPVHWHEWGDEAFARARAEDKPIFLSIGYATCHWCHVMAHESFEDDAVARLLNQSFVAVKLDREERPDIDHLFMLVCQAMSGQCGWPLNVFLTPEGKPFYVTTYVPKHTRHGRLGMLELIPRIAGLWAERRDDVVASADEVTSVLRRNAAPPADPAEPDEAWLGNAYGQLARSFDATHGGFGRAPKFPSPHTLLFLLRYAHRSGSADARHMALHTLRQMRLGGVFDHVGFGFHRYATDAQWLVPHFEKMLYDQALLALAYTEAYQLSGDDDFARTAREILTYIRRDMTAPEGGFYSAEDADSEGVEGKFYVWSMDELRAVLAPEDADFVIETFRVEAEGNFLEEATRALTGENILHLAAPLDAAARARWATIRETLFAHREARIHPEKDDKVLTDWNGLMIAAMAKAARVLGEDDYTEAAERAAAFALGTLRADDGRLLHRWRHGHAGIAAHADDYAFLTFGLLELYQTTFDAAHLEAAIGLTDTLLAHFWDEADGGLFFTADDGEVLLARSKEVYDGAIPSANAITYGNLLRLARLTGDTRWDDRAAALGRFVGGLSVGSPAAFTGFLLGVDAALGAAYEIVIVGDPAADDTAAMRAALAGRYLPNAVVLLRPEGAAPLLTRLAPFTADHRALDGKATAYVCQNFACHQPTTDIAEMLALIS